VLKTTQKLVSTTGTFYNGSPSPLSQTSKTSVSRPDNMRSMNTPPIKNKVKTGKATLPNSTL
jgi:hypothetical protein